MQKSSFMQREVWKSFWNTLCKARGIDVIQKMLSFGPGEEVSISASSDPVYHWPQTSLHSPFLSFEITPQNYIRRTFHNHAQYQGRGYSSRFLHSAEVVHFTHRSCDPGATGDVHTQGSVHPSLHRQWPHGGKSINQGVTSCLGVPHPSFPTVKTERAPLNSPGPPLLSALPGPLPDP